MPASRKWITRPRAAMTPREFLGWWLAGAGLTLIGLAALMIHAVSA
jgi:hypothetical protein